MNVLLFAQTIAIAAIMFLNNSNFNNKISSDSINNVKNQEKPLYSVESTDNINVSASGKLLTVNITTKTGIGKAKIIKNIDSDWPENITIILNSKYMESFTFEIGDISYQLSCTSSNQIIEELIIIENGIRKEKPIENNSEKWVRITNKENCFVIVLPSGICKNKNNNFKITWIDQYR